MTHSVRSRHRVHLSPGRNLVACALGIALTLTTVGCNGSSPKDSGAKDGPEPISLSVAGSTVDILPHVTMTVPDHAFSAPTSFATTEMADSAGVGDGYFEPTSGPVDLQFSGPLAKPVQITYTTDNLGAEELPAIFHQTAGRDWELVAVGKPGSNTATWSSRSFSPTQFGKVSVPDWLYSGADSVTGFVHSVLGKRHGTPTCNPGAPEWAEFRPAGIDAITSCASTTKSDNGVVRAEVRLRNNRGYTQQITVPPGAAFAWVDGQPEVVRSLVRTTLKSDAVLLAPGQDMTVGFERPVKGRFVSIPAKVTPASYFVWLLGNSLSEEPMNNPVAALHVFKECTLFGDLPLNANATVTSLSSAAGSLISCFTALSGNQQRLLILSNSISGGTKSAAPVEKLASKLRMAAKAIAAIDIGSDVIDLLADDYYNPNTTGIDALATTIGLRAAGPPPDRLTDAGFRGVHPGMPLAQAGSILHRAVLDTGCKVWDLGGDSPYVSGSYERPRVVAWLEFADPGVIGPRDIRIGDSIAQVRSKLGAPTGTFEEEQISHWLIPLSNGWTYWVRTQGSTVFTFGIAVDRASAEDRGTTQGGCI